MALLQSYGYLAHPVVAAVDGQSVIPDFDLASFETLTMIVTPDGGLGAADVDRRAHHRARHRQRHQLHHLRGHRGRAARRRGTFLRTPDLAPARLRLLAIGAVAVIVYIQEGQRRIPIQYASRVRGRRMYQGGATFLPLRVNQAGVIPIIFAVSILLFPVQLAQYFANSSEGVMQPRGCSCRSALGRIREVLRQLYREQQDADRKSDGD